MESVIKTAKKLTVAVTKKDSVESSSSSQLPISSPSRMKKSKGMSQPNKIWVELNSFTYCGGDTINGTVECFIEIPVLAKGVVVKLRGYERVWWQQSRVETSEKNGQKTTTTITEEIKQDEEFFNDPVLVQPINGQLGLGRHSFPFTFTLPPNLPSTFFQKAGEKSSGDAYIAKILYKVKATIESEKTIEHSSLIIVGEPIALITPTSYGEDKKPFFSLEGALHGRAWLNKGYYHPGETAIVKLKINNTCKKSSSFIRLKVFHHLDFKAKGHERRVTHLLHTENYSSIPPFFYGVRWFPYNIPVSLLPSSAGPHMSSHYVLNLETVIPNADDLSIPLNMNILASEFLFSDQKPLQPSTFPVPHTISYRADWVTDESAVDCMNESCKKPFTLVNRRHHCRHCNKIFCQNCTSRKIEMPKLGFRKPSRVCDLCYQSALQGGMKRGSAKGIHPQPPNPIPPRPKVELGPSIANDQPQPVVLIQPPPLVVSAGEEIARAYNNGGK